MVSQNSILTTTAFYPQKQIQLFRQKQLDINFTKMNVSIVIIHNNFADQWRMSQNSQ